MLGVQRALELQIQLAAHLRGDGVSDLGVGAEADRPAELLEVLGRAEARRVSVDDESGDAALIGGVALSPSKKKPARLAMSDAVDHTPPAGRTHDESGKVATS